MWKVEYIETLKKIEGNFKTKFSATQWARISLPENVYKTVKIVRVSKLEKGKK